jgi:hypothetical protein
MAFNLTNLNYTQGEAGKYILKTIGKAATLENTTLYPSVKNDLVLQAASIGTLVRNYTGNFTTDTGTVDFKGVTLSLKNKEVVNTISRLQLDQMWDAAQYRAGAFNTAPIEPAMVEFIGNSFAGKIALEVEDEIWNSTGATGTVTGYFKQAADNSDVIDVAAVSAITASNVLDEIQKVYDAMPISLRQSGEAKIYLSPKNMALYRKAVGLLGIYNGSLDTTNVSTLYFDNTVQLISINAIANNKMLATTLANIVIGTDLEADFNEVRAVDLTESGQFDGFRFIMKFKYDAKLIWGGDVVLYA